MEEIAAEAGFSTGAVYSNFDGKEELFLAIVDRQVQDRVAEIEAVADAAEGKGDAGAKAADQFRTFLEADPDWPLLFYEFWSLSVRNPELQGELAKRRGAIRDALADTLERVATELGFELRFPAPALATAIAASLNGLAFEPPIRRRSLTKSSPSSSPPSSAARSAHRTSHERVARRHSGRSTGSRVMLCVAGAALTAAATQTQLVRSLYQAINSRDLEAGFALLDQDFEWVEPEHGLLGGPHRGFDEVRKAIEVQLEVFDEFTIEPEDFHEHGDRVAVSVRQRARGGVSGVEVEIRIGHLWTIKHGKATRLEVFPAREDARQAAELAEQN